MASVWGADVGKLTVVVARHGGGAVAEVANQAQALRRWAKGLGAGSRIGVEASGVHHRLLAQEATAVGHTVYVLNARDVRHYAKGVGRRAKTDRVDAQVIARMVAHEYEHLRPYRRPDPVQQEMSRLLERRHAVVKVKVGLDQALADVSGYGKVREQLKALLRELDADIKRLTEQQAGLGALCQRLRSVPGIGPLLSAGLANLLMQHGFHSGDALIAFLGYDPRACDSGQHRGQRRLSKRGPAEMRRLLYAAAMAAARTQTWKPYYERDRARGLSATEAIVILARRLARTAFSLARYNTVFDPARLAGTCART